MNDQLGGQLCGAWTLPKYVRECTFLETENESVAVEGAKGLFTLAAPADLLTVRWGAAGGPALARLRWQPDSLGWDGRVRIGGVIDALHIGELPNLDDPVVILHVGGQPFQPTASAFPAANERKRVPYSVPNAFDAVDDAVEDGETTWFALEDSPQLVLAQDALVSKLRVACFGRLTEDSEGWHELFALPLALEAMTLYAP